MKRLTSLFKRLSQPNDHIWLALLVALLAAVLVTLVALPHVAPFLPVP